MNKQVIIGALAGGVVSFFLGWLVFGILMMGYFQANVEQCMMLPMEEMKYLPLILFNLVYGILFALIIHWSGSTSLMGGLQKGAIVGFLMVLAIDLAFYAFTEMYLGGVETIVVDVLVNTAFYAVLGGVIGLVMSKVSA